MGPAELLQLALPAVLPWLVAFGAAGVAATGVALVGRALARSAVSRVTIGRTLAATLVVLPVLTGLGVTGNLPTWPQEWSRIKLLAPATWPESSGAASGQAVTTPAIPASARRDVQPADGPRGTSVSNRSEGVVGDPMRVPLANRLAVAMVLLWLVGAAGLLGRVALGLLALRRHGRAARPVPEEVVREARESIDGRPSRGLRVRCGGPFAVPVCWGILHSTILLPAGSHDWSEERARIVLRHEMAHVARRDALHILIARVATALHWFNPLAWAWQRRFEQDVEDLCDEIVVRAGVPGWRYARALVATARDARGALPTPAVPAAIGRVTQLERRVDRILAGAPAARGRLAGVVGAAIVLLVSTATVMASAPPAAVPAPQTDDVEAPARRQASGPEQIVDALILALADPSPDVRRSVVNSLRDLGEPRGLEAVRGVLEDPDRDVRRAAEEVLGLRPPSRNLEFPSTRPEPATLSELEELGDGLSDPDATARLAAARALGNLADSRSVNVLARHLDDADDDVRQAVAAALGHTGDPRAVPALVAAWPDPDPDVRARIVSGLGEVGDPAGTDVVLEGLRDRDVDVRSTAAEALGRLGRGFQDVCPVIPDARGFRLADQIDALLRDPNAAARERAALVLGRLAVGVDPSTPAAAGSGGKTFQHALIAALSDPAPGVRLAAACSLAEVGDQRAVAPLRQRTASSESAELRTASEAAIRSIARRAGSER
jgi:HEAT repeat protein/beta-lactamase regulating signal transducer with metallopeptidase domain